MDILFLTNLLPYPLDNGGKIKTYTTLNSLANAGHKVDLVCFKESTASYASEEKELSHICNSVHQVYQKLTTAENKTYMMILAVKSMFSKFPLSTYKFISKEMKEYLESKKNTNYELIYFDHLPLYVYHKICKEIWTNAKVILDEHNCEATIMKRNAETAHNPIKKAFVSYEASKVKRFESKALLSADKSIILSTEDYKTLRSATGKDFEYSIIPIGVMDRGRKKERDETDGILNVLFVGTLTWEPNNQGLIWFIEKVIPLMESNKMKYHFYIVGKNPSEEVVEKTKSNENITVTGYVDSVDDYYDRCDCTVVPLFIGSGQRVKLIEAFSKGMPSISTSIGAEGLEYINGKTILIADDKNDFMSSISSLLDKQKRKSIGENARKIYEKCYSPEAIEKLLCQAVSF